MWKKQELLPTNFKLRLNRSLKGARFWNSCLKGIPVVNQLLSRQMKRKSKMAGHRLLILLEWQEQTVRNSTAENDCLLLEILERILHRKTLAAPES
ncbi:hypothetical protein DITRI_Ditri15bG0021100 [Diplodiscus trichospermus]